MMPIHVDSDGLRRIIGDIGRQKPLPASTALERNEIPVSSATGMQTQQTSAWLIVSNVSSGRRHSGSEKAGHHLLTSRIVCRIGRTQVCPLIRRGAAIRSPRELPTGDLTDHTVSDWRIADGPRGGMSWIGRESPAGVQLGQIGRERLNSAPNRRCAAGGGRGAPVHQFWLSQNCLLRHRNVL